MKFKIHFDNDKSGHDWYCLDGETIEEIREKAINIWSEKITN